MLRRALWLHWTDWQIGSYCSAILRRIAKETDRRWEDGVLNDLWLLVFFLAF